MQAAKADDLGAQAISKDLGGLPIVEDASVAPGSVRVVLAADYTGPGSGLDGIDPTLATADPVGGRVRPRRPRWPVADHHRRLERPGVRQLDVTTISSAILDPLMASDPAGPRITYYDDATGERIELSTATLVNWAAKTGNLLRDEMGAGPSQPSRGAVARALADRGGVVRDLVDRCRSRHRRTKPTSRCAQPSGSAEADDAVGMGEVAVLSLDPFGKPVPDLPVGVTDYATAVRVHGDQISPSAIPAPRWTAGRSTDVLSGAQASAAAQGFTADDRVLSTAGWRTPTS